MQTRPRPITQPHAPHSSPSLCHRCHVPAGFHPGMWHYPRDTCRGCRHACDCTWEAQAHIPTRASMHSELLKQYKCVQACMYACYVEDQRGELVSIHEYNKDQPKDGPPRTVQFNPHAAHQGPLGLDAVFAHCPYSTTAPSSPSLHADEQRQPLSVRACTQWSLQACAGACAGA